MACSGSKFAFNFAGSGGRAVCNCLIFSIASSNRPDGINFPHFLMLLGRYLLFKFGFRFGIVGVNLSLVGGLFVRLFCMRQTDLKSLIAYSSVAHISMVIGGIMTLIY